MFDNKIMQCNKCSSAIDRKKDRYTVCEGKCAKRYHAACVDLSDDTVNALFSKNVLWMCDECLTDFCNTRDANAEEVEEATNDCCTHHSTCEAEIEELKSKVNDIIDVLTAMVPQRTQPTQPETCIQHHSTPVLPHSVNSARLFDGTRDTNACESLSVRQNSTSATATHTDFGDSFSLFLTNVECNTTNADIVKLVCECLSIVDNSKVRVRRLVSMHREREADYISFKVVLESKWKSLAMQPGTWPKNLKFREFVNRYDVWKPNHC